jgi:hypothetical protein
VAIRTLLLLWAVLILAASGAMAQSSYEYSGNDYTLIINNDPPAGATYSTSMSVRGSFTVAAELAPSMPLTDISGDILAYSFTDGAHLHTQDNSMLFGAFKIATDATGAIIEWQLTTADRDPLGPTGVPGDQRQTISTAAITGLVLDRGQLQECLGSGSSCPLIWSDVGQVLNDAGSWTLVPDPSVLLSFGVQAAQPDTETIDGLAVRPADVVDLSAPSIAFGELISSEDVDAYHETPGGVVIFSTSTAVSLDGQIFAAADLISWNGISYSLHFDGASLLGPGQNIDAVTLLPGNRMLISTAIPATLYGFGFQDGDVVVVDRFAESAALFQGLDEATLFTGTNQNIDALHYDVASGELMLSILIDGQGTAAGVPYTAADDMFASVIRFLPAEPSSGMVFVDGVGLFDGATRQLDAFSLPASAPVPVLGPLGLGLLSAALCALGGLGIARRR